MARYELGAVYKIPTDTGHDYYVRLLEGDKYGVFAPLDEEPCEETFAKTPYRLYFCCSSFPVKRGMWEKILPSPNAKDIELWRVPLLANYGNYNPALFLEQHCVYRDGNAYVCDKDLFIRQVRAGLISNIFNRYEIIPAFLERHYDGWPESYILDEIHLSSGTQEWQEQKLAALKEIMGD